jgi:hypothetical protein
MAVTPPVLKSQFVSMHVNPTHQAFAETNVLLAAYMDALSSLLALSLQEPEVTHIVEGMYQNYVVLKDVRSVIEDNMQKADVMIEAIEARLAI